MLLLTGMILTIRRIGRIELNSSVNAIRVQLNSHVNQVSEGSYEPCEYPYLVVNCEGKLLYHTPSLEYEFTEPFNVQELIQTDISFHRKYPSMKKEVFLIQSRKQVTGFVVYLIPESIYEESHWRGKLYRSLYPMAISIVVVFILTIGYMLYQKRLLLYPISEISQSAKAIIEGDYSREVIRTYETNVRENEIGDLIYSFELMRDEIKERQIREENMKKSQQELISCISHDLKTPISTIQAYTEGIRDGIARTPEQQQQYITIILQKLKLMYTMIEELLEYSNAQLNHLSIEMREMYIKDYWQHLMHELSVYCKMNGASFESNTIKADVLVHIDPKRITEVMYNLIENSLKYRSEAPLKIEVNLFYQDSKLGVTVSDNGKGVAAEDLGRIFDKFYRADQSRSSNIPGSGLGLSIVKYIVEHHGGELTCKSAQGFHITFLLPIV